MVTDKENFIFMEKPHGESILTNYYKKSGSTEVVADVKVKKIKFLE